MMSSRIAVLGASGFVGSRLVELWHLTGRANVRPVVRNVASLARLARFDLDWRIADARDQEGMTKAFSGCDIVVNLIAADASIIVENAVLSYRAAQAAGVKRMVFMSSASVHGQAPAPGTDETSPLHTNHIFAYNNAKVRAERALMALRKTGSVELTILRPGIVFGPRSRWISDIANQLLMGTAYLINQGHGICNSIYVDNLIEAVGLSIHVAAADQGVFIVGDRERVTWLNFYEQIAAGLGLDCSQVHYLPPPEFKHGLAEKLNALRASSSAQALLPLVPSALKDAVKGALKAVTSSPSPSPWSLTVESGLQVTEEYSALHQCSVQLPWKKAELVLGYEPSVSFPEGIKRSVGWLSFAGYPHMH